MKALRIILGILLGLVLLYLVLCLAGPKKVNVLRKAEIAAPAPVVYGFLYDFRQWEKWSVWQLGDTAMVNTYSGNPSGLGAVNSWVSGKYGNGSMEIVEEEAPKYLKIKLQFEGMDPTHSFFKLEDKEGCRSAVSWSMEDDKPLPFFARGMMIFMNQMVGGDFKKGLKNLKSLSEEMVANLPGTYRGIAIEEVDFPARTLAGIRQKLDMKAMPAFFASGLGLLGKAMGEAGITPAGPPLTLYYEWDETTGRTDMAVSFPLSTATNLPGAEIIELPAAKALMAKYMGSYEGIANGHFALDDYMRDRCLTPKMPIIEEYVTDPAAEKDTLKWETRIYYFYE